MKSASSSGLQLPIMDAIKGGMNLVIAGPAAAMIRAKENRD